MSFFGSIFSAKPKIEDESLNQAIVKNEDEDTSSSSNQSDEEKKESNIVSGVWDFLVNIINLVERRFSKEDQISVKEIGKTLNDLGAKFLGEIKVGKQRREPGVSQGAQVPGKEQQQR